MRDSSTLETLLGEHYGAIHALDAMHGGAENDVFQVTFSSRNRAVAHVYRRKSIQQVCGEIQLLRLLRGRVKCAHLIEPSHGEYPLTAGGHPVTLTEFLDGKHIKRSALSAEIFVQIGRNLNALHTISKGVCLRRYWGIQELLQHCQMHINLFSGCPQYAAQRDLVVHEQAVVQELLNDQSTNAMIHADVDESNLIHNNGSVALIDFDDCGFAPAALDLAITLRNLVIKRSVKDPLSGGIELQDAAEALMYGYGHRVARLGTWIRVACFRHAILMLHGSFCDPFYDSQNRGNLRMLEVARNMEHNLNEAFK